MFKKSTVLLIITLVFGCKTKRTFYLDNEFLKEKTIIFSLHEKSDYQDVVKVGEHIGNSKDPNVREVFRESIQELDELNQANLMYSSTYNFPSDSIISVNVTIKKIVWEFNEPTATMNVFLEYQMENKTIDIVGVNQFKLFVVGTKTGNLKKGFRDANIQFLATINDL